MTPDEARALAKARLRLKGGGGGGEPVTGDRANQVLGALSKSLGGPDGVSRDPTSFIDEARRKRKNEQSWEAYQKLPWYAKPFVAGQDIVGSMSDAVTLGYGDKAVAGLRSAVMPGAGTYDEELAKAREQTEQQKYRSGWAGTVGDVAGMVATLPEAAALKGAPVVGGTVEALANRWLGRAALSAAEGAAYGGATAAGHDEDVLRGIALGGAFGAGGSAIFDALKAGGTAASRFVGDYAAEPLQRAKAMIYDKAKAAGISPELVDKWLATHGDELMTADMLGNQGTSLGRSAANVSPEARETLESAVGARKEGQNLRLADTIDEAAGVDTRLGLEDLQKATYAERKPAIDKAYEEARAAGYDLPRTPFEDILSSPMGSKAYDDAATSLLNRKAVEGIDATSELARLDQTKRQLDDIATSNFRSGNKDTGDQAAGLARLLRNRMDESIAGPEYSGARAARREAFKAEEAINQGAELAKPRIKLGTPERAAATAPEHQPLLAKGYAAQQAEQLLNKGATEGALGPISTPMGKQAAAAALGEEGAAKVGQRVKTERMFNKTNRDIVGNSTTARQLLEALGMSAGGGVGGYALSYLDPTGLVGPKLGAAIAGYGKGKALLRGLQERMAMQGFKRAAPDIAELLVSSPKTIPSERGIPTGVLEDFFNNQVLGIDAADIGRVIKRGGTEKASHR